MFGNIKMMILAASVTAVAVAIGLLYWQNQSLKKDNDILIGNNATLESVASKQKATIEEAVSAIKEWGGKLDTLVQSVGEMTEISRQASSETRRLNNVFARHDMERLSLAKPGLIERRINRGTADVLGMFERETNRSMVDTGGDRAAKSSQAESAEPPTDRDK